MNKAENDHFLIFQKQKLLINWKSLNGWWNVRNFLTGSIGLQFIKLGSFVIYLQSFTYKHRRKNHEDSYNFYSKFRKNCTASILILQGLWNRLKKQIAVRVSSKFLLVDFLRPWRIVIQRVYKFLNFFYGPSTCEFQRITLGSFANIEKRSFGMGISFSNISTFFIN